MSTATTSRAGRIFNRVRDVWAELDYAQRRLLEIQTGVSGVTQTHARVRADGGPAHGEQRRARASR